MNIVPLQDDPPPWRESVLELVLRVASLSVPVGVLVGLATLSTNGKPVDIVMLILVGVACAVVALRWLPQLGFEVRAVGLIMTFQLVSATVLATTGALPGASLASAIAAVLAAILFGTRAMVALLVLTVLIHLAFGLMAHDGTLILRTADTDPTQLRNWLRPASTTVLLSGVLASVVAHVVRQLETGARALRTMYRELSVLHRKLDAAKEHAERMLSHELQDEVSQTLTALKLRLQLWRASGAAITEKDLDDALMMVDDVIARAHTLTVGLRPPLLDDLGLEPALRALVEERARESGLDANMEALGLEERLPIELETACFRIVEEAVTNATHHAHAKHLVVSLRRSQGQLHIRVQDDGSSGSALDGAARAEAGHLDLIGLRARVRMLGGELAVSEIDSAPRGVRVEVVLPLDSKPA